MKKSEIPFKLRFVGKPGRIRGTMYGLRCDKTPRQITPDQIDCGKDSITDSKDSQEPKDLKDFKDVKITTSPKNN